MASEATNKLDPSRDSNTLHEKEKRSKSPLLVKNKTRRNLISKIKVIARDLKRVYKWTETVQERNDIELEMLLRNKSNV